jgi:hypothetical protein
VSEHRSISRQLIDIGGEAFAVAKASSHSLARTIRPVRTDAVAPKRV